MAIMRGERTNQRRQQQLKSASTLDSYVCVQCPSHVLATALHFSLPLSLWPLYRTNTKYYSISTMHSVAVNECAETISFAFPLAQCLYSWLGWHIIFSLSCCFGKKNQAAAAAAESACDPHEREPTTLSHSVLQQGLLLLLLLLILGHMCTCMGAIAGLYSYSVNVHISRLFAGVRSIVVSR